MTRWDDPRGVRSDFDRERWRLSPPGRRDAERGSYDPPIRRPDPYARDEDAGAAGYERLPPFENDGAYPPGGEADAYHGQEYGVESHGYGAAEPDPGWGLDPRDEERRRNFDLDDPGSGQSQAGYATRSTHAHQFDPDYVRWREEQLRNHDRVYEAWRRRQIERYDEQYRRAHERRG